jgi:hypothetical protein
MEMQAQLAYSQAKIGGRYEGSKHFDRSRFGHRRCQHGRASKSADGGDLNWNINLRGFREYLQGRPRVR